MTDGWPLVGLDVAALVRTGWSPIPFRQFVLKLHGRCNLACDYCYMYRLADHSWAELPVEMSPSAVAATVQRIAEHVVRHDLERIDVVLHGGEPLLRGPAMLGSVATSLRERLPLSTELFTQVQTNGVLLDDTVLATLARHRIHVGISLDGTRNGHDRHRRHVDGRGSYGETARALRLLGTDRYRRLFSGILTVVDIDTDPVDTYESLLAFAPPAINFLLPHGNWSAPPPGRPPDPDRTPYGDWLVAAFDRWYGATSQETDVRLFAEVLNLVLGGASRSESIGLSPVAVVAVNTDGSMEQVDTLRSAYHGAAATGLNVHDNTFDDALRHPAIVARQIGSAALSDTCLACHLRDYCGGGYYPHRYRRGAGFRNPSVYCPDLIRLISHVAARVRSDVMAASSRP